MPPEGRLPQVENRSFFWATTTHCMAQRRSPMVSVEFAHFTAPENKLPMMRFAERMKLISFSSPPVIVKGKFSTAQIIGAAQNGPQSVRYTTASVATTF
jgi:hypothetical protein